ncbi:MAG TPA: type II toxin-antitoxin system Phd/YefM family antitoxin [Roseiarcus sp.]|jgi:prevent-host-death family protein
MKSWPVQDAKAHFSEMLVACEQEGPQVVTKRGVETAVLVPIEEWRRLAHDGRPSLKDLLSTDEARFDDLDIPFRGRTPHRPPPIL